MAKIELASVGHRKGGLAGGGLQQRKVGMKAFPKVGLLVLVALLATAAVATSAQAISINPDNTAVSGVATDSALTYGVAFVTCDNATADGTTGLDSDRISDLVLAFDTNCAVAGVGPADVTCTGDVTLIAENASTDRGKVDLNSGFRCDVVTTLCTITVQGPQTLASNTVGLNESTDVLNANVGVAATRVGSSLCGPASGNGSFQANYATSPSNLTIDP
jgi:hypothetical protein